jgi:hypothetical protein
VPRSLRVCRCRTAASRDPSHSASDPAAGVQRAPPPALVLRLLAVGVRPEHLLGRLGRLDVAVDLRQVSRAPLSPPSPTAPDRRRPSNRAAKCGAALRTTGRDARGRHRPIAARSRRRTPVAGESGQQSSSRATCGSRIGCLRRAVAARAYAAAKCPTGLPSASNAGRSSIEAMIRVMASACARSERSSRASRLLQDSLTSATSSSRSSTRA